MTFFTIFLCVPSLRYVIPGIVIFGTAPNFCVIWWIWRLLSLPLPKKIFWKGDQFLYELYQRLVVFFAEYASGTRLCLYGPHGKSLLSSKENVLYLSNHQTVVDWIIADMLAIRQGKLGAMRYVLKHGLRFFPLYGWYFRMHGSVYVKRHGKFVVDKFNKHIAPLNELPVWMVVFPEGTRLNLDKTESIIKSKAFAEKQGYKGFDHVLFPRYKAVWMTRNAIGDSLDAVYDVTLAYSKTLDKKTGQRIQAPGMTGWPWSMFVQTEFIGGNCPTVHAYVDRLNISDIPTDEFEITSFLYDRFLHKERLLQRFYGDDPLTAESFPGEATISRVKAHETVPAFLFFVTFGLVMMSTPTGRRCYILSSTVGTALTLLWMALTNR